MTTESTTYLKYANVQIGAEAIYTDGTSSPGQVFAGAISVATLIHYWEELQLQTGLAGTAVQLVDQRISRRASCVITG